MSNHKSQEDILLQSCGTEQIISHFKSKSLNVNFFDSKLESKFVTRLNLDKLQ